jgi:hypothetical protein
MKAISGLLRGKRLIGEGEVFLFGRGVFLIPEVIQFMSISNGESLDQSPK